VAPQIVLLAKLRRLNHYDRRIDSPPVAETAQKPSLAESGSTGASLPLLLQSVAFLLRSPAAAAVPSSALCCTHIEASATPLYTMAGFGAKVDMVRCPMRLPQPIGAMLQPRGRERSS
jgi:hypothetical protein